MASPSNFMSANKDSAYWGYTSSDGASTIERTQGYTFVRTLQSNLKNVMGNQGSVPTYKYTRSASSGSTPTTSTVVNGGDLVVDGVWGPITNRLLAAYLLRFGASPEAMSAVDFVARNEKDKTINADAVKAAIWVAYGGQSPPDEMLSAITIFDKTTLPVWGKAAPKDAPNSAGRIDRVPVAGGYTLADAATAMPDYSASGAQTTPAGTQTTPVIASPTPTQPASVPTQHATPPPTTPTTSLSTDTPAKPPPATIPTGPGGIVPVVPDATVKPVPAAGWSTSTKFIAIGAGLLGATALGFALYSFSNSSK